MNKCKRLAPRMTNVDDVADAYKKLRELRPDLTDPLDDCFRRMAHELSEFVDSLTTVAREGCIDQVKHDTLPPGPDNFITRTPYPVTAKETK